MSSDEAKLVGGGGTYNTMSVTVDETHEIIGQINNENLEILPGSLLDIEVFYNDNEALSVADTSIIFEDEKKFVYKILDNNKIQKTEVVTGIRKDGNLQIFEGLNADDRIVKEGLSRLSEGMLVRPIIK